MIRKNANIVRFALVITTLLSLLITRVGLCANENDNVPSLSNITLHNSHGYYFVRLFCGYWPIPKKYIAMWTEDGNVGLFGDGTLFDINTDVMKSGGNILFGRYSKSAMKKRFSFRDHEFDVTNENYHGFKISIYNQKVTPEKLPKIVVIHDDYEFIEISDPDDNYWKNSLGAFLRIRSVLPRMHGELFNSKGEVIHTRCSNMNGSSS